MKFKDEMKKITLGNNVKLEALIQVARYGAMVDFSAEYINRVNKARALVDKWVDEEKVMYGITTGFGLLCTAVIDKDQTATLQRNIVLSHSTSVGEPFTIEESRAIMFMILQNLGQGFSGVRIEVLNQYKDFLNKGVTPWAPREGSIGYLSPEAHMARVISGEGMAYYDGQLMEGSQALEKAGLKPILLSSKEGLALISGTTSVTALGAIAIYDLVKCALSADIISALTLEASKGIIKAFDERAMKVRPHKYQGKTAETVRRILQDSEVIEKSKNARVQDAMSLRCIPQLHGSCKKTLYDAIETIEVEMNSCCDNPIVWAEEGNEAVISACNPDSSFVGIEMDSAAIAATNLAKMSERRNNRLISETTEHYPSFLISKPGLNSGLMIPQYTQAALLNDMRILSTPATIDNTSTCGNQEDYVAMGYNASKKALALRDKLEYILAIELLSDFESQGFEKDEGKRSSITMKVFNEIAKTVPLMKEDIFLYPHIETLKTLIHSGKLVQLVQEELGELE